MITAYASEQRGGRIKITTDKGCLPPDAIRTSTRIFPDYDSILETAEMYWNRGFTVCVETEYGNADYEQ